VHQLLASLSLFVRVATVAVFVAVVLAAVAVFRTEFAVNATGGAGSAASGAMTPCVCIGHDKKPSLGSLVHGRPLQVLAHIFFSLSMVQLFYHENLKSRPKNYNEFASREENFWSISH
jgi:hypothetical protein